MGLWAGLSCDSYRTPTLSPWTAGLAIFLTFENTYIVPLVPCLACAAMKEFEMTQLALNCDCEELWRLRDADVGPSFFNVLYSGKGEL